MTAGQKPTKLQTKDVVACIQHYFAEDKKIHDAVVDFKNALGLEMRKEVYPSTWFGQARATLADSFDFGGKEKYVVTKAYVLLEQMAMLTHRFSWMQAQR